MQEQRFQLVLNGVPYIVKAKGFDFNGETRFNVRYNGSEEFVFAYDSSVGQYVAIGEDAETVPTDVEVAIADKLYSFAGMPFKSV